MAESLENRGKLRKLIDNFQFVEMKEEKTMDNKILHM